jgi:hypothetical protein
VNIFQLKYEGVSAKYRATLVDDAQVPIPVGQISTITLTLYVADGPDSDPELIINNRNHQDVKNLNGVTIDSLGKLVWKVRPIETKIEISKRDHEIHYALFEVTYGADDDFSRHMVGIWIPNTRRAA